MNEIIDKLMSAHDVEQEEAEMKDLFPAVKHPAP